MFDFELFGFSHINMAQLNHKTKLLRMKNSRIKELLFLKPENIPKANAIGKQL